MQNSAESTKIGDGLIDYKFYCFNGTPRFLYLGFANIIDGVKHDMLSFLNLDWSPAPFYRTDHEQFPANLARPACLDEMVFYATKLSKNIPFVRVDFYSLKNAVYFSELTFMPGSGYGVFSPPKWERELGDWITLPPKTYELQ